MGRRPGGRFHPWGTQHRAHRTRPGRVSESIPRGLRAFLGGACEGRGTSLMVRMLAGVRDSRLGSARGRQAYGTSQKNGGGDDGMGEHRLGFLPLHYASFSWSIDFLGALWCLFWDVRLDRCVFLSPFLW
jgi:hypothetical protein